jgi:phosphomannomutase/phosphoglucomutase
MLNQSLSTIDPSIFRTYDIRGIVGSSLTKETIFLIGQAIGSLLQDEGEKEIIVARDGRLSSPLLIENLCAGIQSSGCHVLDIGMVPTPLLYYAAQIGKSHSGVMLTGSHNPPEYNGIKVVIKGTTFSEVEIKKLYERILSGHFYYGEGTRNRLNIQENYIKRIISDIHLMRPLSIVIDAGNGVAGVIAPILFKALGCTVHEIFCEIDGRFPNHHPDPSRAENLQDLIQVVKEKKADVGLAFDGDGDRLGIVTAQGHIISADRLLMLFARTLLSHHQGAKIIFDVKCTNNLTTLIRALGGEPLMWKTGHSLIKAKMIETQAQLAGEMSGHIFFKDRWYGFDDALYTGARLLEILAQLNQSSDEVFSEIPISFITPELKIAIREEEKFQLMQELISQAHFPEAIEMNTIDGLRVSFAEGWGLIRASNTTPYLILRFEATNESVLLHIQNLFRAWILSVRSNLILPF